jgi:hypothetical protein
VGTNTSYVAATNDENISVLVDSNLEGADKWDI